MLIILTCREGPKIPNFYVVYVPSTILKKSDLHPNQIKFVCVIFSLYEGKSFDTRANTGSEIYSCLVVWGPRLIPFMILRTTLR